MKSLLKFAVLLLICAGCASAQNLGYVSESATNGSNYTAGVQYDSQNCDAWVRCNYSSEFCTAGEPQDQLHRKFVLISRTYQGESEQTEHWRLDFQTPQFWESYTITDANIGPAFIYDNKIVCDGWHNDAIDFGIDFRQIAAPTAADFELSKKLKAAMQSSK